MFDLPMTLIFWQLWGQTGPMKKSPHRGPQGPQDGRRRAVVFLDEAGLPQEKVESLKAIHYHLDAGRRHVKHLGPLVDQSLPSGKRLRSELENHHY